MAAAAGGGGGGGEAVQKALQSVAQSTGWTYSLLWRLCPRQGALVWAEGHYNGAIRTRKTTVHQPEGGEEGAEGEEEETATAAGAARAALRRSRQLKELYDSLAGEAAAENGGGGGAGGSRDGDGGAQRQQVVSLPPPARRPTAALAPEDLTETEWFYLMCASYCFPPAVGLLGEAFVRRVHVWLCGANKVDSKVFSRAILARSAGIQTVACIPVDDGVLEIGTTENVEEDIGLIQYARSIFMDQIGAPILPTLSGHSTSSTPTTHINHQPLPKMGNCIGDINVQKNSLNPGDEHNNEMEDDDDRIGLLETNTENDSSRHSPQDTNVGSEKEMLDAGSSELMLIGTSESVRDGCSKQEGEEIPVLMVCQNANLAAQGEFGPWQDFLDEDLSGKYLQSSAAEDQVVLAENAHYVETVMAILRFNACRQTQAASDTKAYLALSKNSSFSRWTSWNHKASNDLQSMSLIPDEGAAQRMLKSILLGAPSSSSHRSYRGHDAVQSPEPRVDDGEGTSRSRRAPPAVPVQQPVELSASHVLKERRRREKLNERFVMLRSLVPFVTKVDRASILGDTIEYVKQLRRRNQELESRVRLVDSNSKTAMAQPPPAAASTETTKRGRHHTNGGYLARAGTATAAEASGSCCDTNSSVGEPPARAAGDTEVQVSIIESDALLELRCPHREGLLLRVMQALHQELRLEVTSVQASSAGDVLLAELRAKVKEVHGRRSSITEVKRAIHLIVSSD